MGRGGGGIFDFFFGGGGGPFGGGEGGEEEEEERKGHDVVVDLPLSLKDLYVGREIRTVRDKVVLKPAPGKRKCNCKQKIVTRQLGPGMYQQYTQSVCEECPNVKKERDQEDILVHVEPGMVDGQVREMASQQRARGRKRQGCWVACDAVSVRRGLMGDVSTPPGGAKCSCPVSLRCISAGWL